MIEKIYITYLNKNMPQKERRGHKTHKGGDRQFTDPQILEHVKIIQEDPIEIISDEDEENYEYKPKGIEGLIEIENPNHNNSGTQIKQKKLSKLTIDEISTTKSTRNDERQKVIEINHQDLKTEQARADLARLSIIRKQREEAAKIREQEKISKELAKSMKK